MKNNFGCTESPCLWVFNKWAAVLSNTSNEENASNLCLAEEEHFTSTTRTCVGKKYQSRGSVLD